MKLGSQRIHKTSWAMICELVLANLVMLWIVLCCHVKHFNIRCPLHVCRIHLWICIAQAFKAEICRVVISFLSSSSLMPVLKKPATQVIKGSLKKPAAKGQGGGKDQSSDAGTMSLQEKIASWKEKNDVAANLELDRNEQKNVLSQFKNALNSAPQEAKDAWEKASTASAGQKHLQKQAVVKGWLLDRSWGETFLHSVQSLSFDKSFLEKEKPISKKELQMKYDDDEIERLLEDGGIVPVKHSKNSSLQMYIDKSNWERQRKVSKTHKFEKNQQGEIGEDEVNLWDQSFSHDPWQDGGHGKIMDLFRPNRSIENKQENKDKEKEKEKDKNITKEKLDQLASTCVGLLQKKTMNLEKVNQILSKEPKYGKSIRKETESILKKLNAYQDICRKMYLDQKFDVKSGEKKLQEIQGFCNGTLKGHLKILDALKA